ncbi:MAG: hypothetical protein NTV23_09940 [Propionibacteriales bacterium]|nr:hypothetical protein [Propionibacteriales bacterium]
MRFVGRSLVQARAQGFLAVVVVAVVTTAFGCLVGDELIGIPGLVTPIPAVRVFPAVLAAIGSLAVLEPWREFEVAGARSAAYHRAVRFGVGLLAVLASGAALGANAEVMTILVLALLFYAAMVVAVGLIGRHWWVLAALALYAQLFIQEYDQLRPGPDVTVLAVLVAGASYLVRGEAVLGRSRPG